jgi:hypothetical protein
MTDPQAPPGRPTLVLIALLLAAAGLFTMLHGLGLVSAAWLRPNPATPAWVFTVIGLFLVLGAMLAGAPVVKMPNRAVQVAGYAAIAAAMVMANWLVFSAEGTSCGIGGAGLLQETGGLLCRGVAGFVVLLFDGLLAVAVLPVLWRRKT